MLCELCTVFLRLHYIYQDLPTGVLWTPRISSKGPFYRHLRRKVLVDSYLNLWFNAGLRRKQTTARAAVAWTPRLADSERPVARPVLVAERARPGSPAMDGWKAPQKGQAAHGTDFPCQKGQAKCWRGGGRIEGFRCFLLVPLPAARVICCKQSIIGRGQLQAFGQGILLHLTMSAMAHQLDWSPVRPESHFCPDCGQGLREELLG